MHRDTHGREDHEHDRESERPEGRDGDEEDEAEDDFGPPDQPENGPFGPGREPRPTDHRQLIGVPIDQFGDRTLIEPDEADDRPGQDMEQASLQRDRGRNPFLGPEPKTIEAPRGGPAHQGSEAEGIEGPVAGTESDAVVLAVRNRMPSWVGMYR